jgi:hypothetical protein
MAMLLLWVAIASISVWTEANGSNIYEFKEVKVEKLGEFHYEMKPAQQPEFYVTVCRDYSEPQFTSGMTLSEVIFADEGRCWSLNPNKHAGYYIQRDRNGNPN